MKILKVFLYVVRLYVESITMIVAFLTGRYSVGVVHLPTKHVNVESWTRTLSPASVVFEVESSYLHVHVLSVKKR